MYAVITAKGLAALKEAAPVQKASGSRHAHRTRRAQQRYLSPCAVRLAWRVTLTELYRKH